MECIKQFKEFDWSIAEIHTPSETNHLTSNQTAIISEDSSANKMVESDKKQSNTIHGLTISSFYSKAVSHTGRVSTSSINSNSAGTIGLGARGNLATGLSSARNEKVKHSKKVFQTTGLSHSGRFENRTTKRQSVLGTKSVIVKRIKSNISSVRKTNVKSRCSTSDQRSVSKTRHYAPVAVTLPVCSNLPRDCPIQSGEISRNTVKDMFKCNSIDVVRDPFASGDPNLINERITMHSVTTSHDDLVTDRPSKTTASLDVGVPDVRVDVDNNVDENCSINVMEIGLSPPPVFSLFSHSIQDPARTVFKVESRSPVPPKLCQPVLRQKRLKEDVSRKEQMVLDFGQTPLGTIQCSSCGMTYNPGQPADELTHDKYHKNLFHCLKFTGWSTERVVQDRCDGSRILVVLPEDKAVMKRMSLVKSIVDKDLGFVLDEKISTYSKIFLYVLDKRIVGFCAALPINQGYRMLSGEMKGESSGRPCIPAHCCSTVPEPARCGINRIWVLSSERRKHIATRLLDAVRAHFIMGYHISLSEIAFSDPTPDGIKLASSYCGAPCFLVYKTAAA